MPVIDPNTPFKWRHYESEIILLNVRWYCRYTLSYRDLKVHTTIYRWVQAYAPELDKRCRSYLKPTNDSWKVDKTYVKVKGKWKYLYRAIDSEGNTLDFMLSAKRDKASAIRFFKKILYAQHTDIPRVINVDKNAAYPPAMEDLKEAKLLPIETELRQVKYLNNRIEQDHRFIKRSSSRRCRKEGCHGTDLFHSRNLRCSCISSYHSKGIL
jgi:transposase, IS6 family